LIVTESGAIVTESGAIVTKSGAIVTKSGAIVTKSPVLLKFHILFHTFMVATWCHSMGVLL